ncbi:MAG: hypothetical protein ACTH3B_15675 [Pseudoalteromonas sp.]
MNNFKITPAHSIEAKAWATVLFNEWNELIEHVSSPHEPIYITAENNAHEVIGEILSRYIKYNYSHGMVLNMLENAGVGYSP